MAAPVSAKVQSAPIPVSPAIDPTQGVLQLNVFNGARQPFPLAPPVLVTITDGQQNRLFWDEIPHSSVPFALPIHNNLADNYSVVASADGYLQAGFHPVKMVAGVPQTLNLMLLLKAGTFHFAHAKWADVVARKKKLGELLTASAGPDPAFVYGQLEENTPGHLACLLNITTALEQISLPRLNPLSYFKLLDLPALAPDRFFGYADAKLLDQLKQSVQRGIFTQEPSADLGLHSGGTHGPATSSFKQIQFGEANVQLTFHETNRRNIDGVDCVCVEPDIDYFKDPLAHAALEVIPNLLSGAVSDPRAVYVLRWIAGLHAGIPEFDPLYTTE